LEQAAVEAKLKFERDDVVQASPVVQASLDGAAPKSKERRSENGRSFGRRKSVGSYDTVSAFSGEGSFSTDSDQQRKEKHHTEKDYWAKTHQKVSTIMNNTVLIVGSLVVMMVVLTSLLAGFFRNFPWLVAKFLSFVGAIIPICEGVIAENKTCPPPPSCVEGGGYRY
jgi:hypothetical protein